jgi:hypothetical protein
MSCGSASIPGVTVTGTLLWSLTTNSLALTSLPNLRLANSHARWVERQTRGNRVCKTCCYLASTAADCPLATAANWPARLELL